jgi:hypothetical protein
MTNQNTPKADTTTPWHGMTVSELHDVKLPLSVHDWRAAHVQAWLGLKLDLPQYIPKFKEAAIDGLVLLNCVDKQVLNDTLLITGIHNDVIYNGIQALKKQQYDYDRKKEAALKAQLAEQKAVEETLKKKKKKKKKTDEKAQTWFGDVREHNAIERVKLMREMKTLREKQSKEKQKVQERSATWKFEYNGLPKPVSDSEEMWNMSNNAGTSNSKNTTLFEQTMNNIFQNEDILQGTMSTNPKKHKEIRSDCSFEEVLAITKAAMYEVSTRLVEIERIKDENNQLKNDDLEDDDVLLLSKKSSHVGTNKNISYDDEDDEEEPPPAYIEEFPLSSRPVKEYNRTKLLFQEFVNQKNNHARWLGENNKLTRLKLLGGLTSILHLQIPRDVFDVFWNHLDYRRSGELDIEEFTKFFGNFSEF